MDSRSFKLAASNATDARAWVISAPLGKGLDLVSAACESLAAEHTLIRADQYPGIPRRDAHAWSLLQEQASILSSIASLPFIGSTLQRWLERALHKLPPRYPRHQDPFWTRRLIEFYYYLQMKGLGYDLIHRLAEEAARPLITSSPVLAFAAEVHGYPGQIFLACHTADPSRAWAPLEPEQTRIHWIVPTQTAEQRLQSYGVPSSHVHHFGFPLSTNAISPKGLHADINARIARLDPHHVFRAQKEHHADKPLNLALIADTGWRTHDLVTFVKGASAAIRANQLVLHIFTGANQVRTRLMEAIIQNQGLRRYLGSSLLLHAGSDEHIAYHAFVRLMPQIDLVWSVASPWVFYTGLGLPFIVQPPVGGQEEARYAWLRGIQAGLAPLELETMSEWLLDWKRSGGLARLAWNGYGAAPSEGFQRLNDLLQGKHPHEEALHATIPE